MKIKAMTFQFVIGCLSSAVFASEQSGLPWNLLGSRLCDIESQFLVTIYDGAFEDEYFNGRDDERLLVIDSERRYLTLHTVDRMVKEIFVSDRLYATDRGIRIGDLLSEVRMAYPEAFAKIDAHNSSRSRFHVSEGSGRVTFWFRYDDVPRRQQEGEAVPFNDEAVGRSKLWQMHMTPE